MSLADAYSPCLCGSGQKYKWCCQKVEAYYERSQRLVRSGQLEMALKPLDEGLGKFPDSPLLLLRKAFVLVNLGQMKAALRVLDLLLERQPGHVHGLILKNHVVYEHEGPEAAARVFQEAWSAATEENRAEIAALAHRIGLGLRAIGLDLAALRHFELAASGGSDVAPQAARARAEMEAAPGITHWSKNPYTLSPAPTNAGGDFREKFARALDWARDGAWAAAAAAFDLLSADSRHGAVADRNQGLCRLWFADQTAAIESIRRYIARTPPCDDVLELEALCQTIEEPPPAETWDVVQLSWPLRDRARLLESIAGDRTCAQAAKRPLDGDDPDSPEVEAFILLDRPMIEARPDLTPREIPLLEAVLMVGPDMLVLEAHDDGGLDQLTDRVLALAGRAIPPAHPRTKIVDRNPKFESAFVWHAVPPRGMQRTDIQRIQRDRALQSLVETWPTTPNPSLDWRTPLEASSIPELRLPLRAALLVLRCLSEEWVDRVDWTALYHRHKLEPEPAIDPAAVDVGAIHIARLELVPIDALDDDRLITLFARAQRYGIGRARSAAARRIAGRMDLMAREAVPAREILSLLVLETADDGDAAAAAEWLRKGREFEETRSARDPFRWDLVELESRIRTEPPESWATNLAVLLDRGKSNTAMNSRLLVKLIGLGLVRVLSAPDRPEEYTLDTRVLEAVLSQYGPRVRTADGKIGLAESESRVWTPDQAPAEGGIWTPGAQPAPAERPRLILPGQ